jgi:hypothetical protein
MKPLPSTTASLRPDILRAKLVYGLWFGTVLGLTFSIFAWGIDAYQLARVNGLHPWLKFLGGAVPCIVVGAITGWLSARFDKPVVSMLLWLAAALIFARLTLSVPFQITPRLVNLVEPHIQGLLHYSYYPEFSTRFGVAYFWLALLMALAGLIQLPMSEPAVFSSSLFGKITPMLVILAMMLIAGTTVDNMNNEALRSPVSAVDLTVQYYLDHQGQDIAPATYRQMHLAALRTVQDLITPERAFMISGYNEYLEQVQVLGKFEHGWVECQVFNNQLVSCKQVE